MTCTVIFSYKTDCSGLVHVTFGILHAHLYICNCYTIGTDDLVSFTNEETKEFERRLEEGFNLSIDPRYNMWLTTRSELNVCV